MEAVSRLRFRVLFRWALSPFSSFRPFSISPAAENPSNRSFFFDDSDGGSGSSVYEHALKFQRPSSISWRGQFQNSVSLIGTVDAPIREINVEHGNFGVFTVLKVKTSRKSNRSFRILLKMWGNKIAETCANHLKQNDFIYVSGHLRSFSEDDQNGKSRICHVVIVKEINYVSQYNQGLACQKAEELRSGNSGETGLDKYQNHLHLWQVLFANPHEWHDNRKSKKNPNAPDFKHKSTGEALWLSCYDPPWITKQLEVHDSKMARECTRECESSYSQVSPLVYDDM